MTEEQEVLARLGEALLEGDDEVAPVAVQAALDRGISIKTIMSTIREAMDMVGQKYHCKKFFLPELVLSGQAAQAAMEVLMPRMAASSAEFLGTVVLGTVEGDIHDLGKSAVLMMLSAAGFLVYDLGIDVPASKFVDKAREVGADIIASSALMATSTNRMKDIEEALVKAGIRERVKTMVGGAAVTPQFVKLIGADGYGRDAHEAVVMAKSLVGLVATP